MSGYSYPPALPDLSLNSGMVHNIQGIEKRECQKPHLNSYFRYAAPAVLATNEIGGCVACEPLLLALQNRLG